MRLPKTMDLFTPSGLMSFYRLTRDELNKGRTGTITLDDGANWRVVLTFEDGKLMAATSAASTGAEATIDWE